MVIVLCKKINSSCGKEKKEYVGEKGFLWHCWGL